MNWTRKHTEKIRLHASIPDERFVVLSNGAAVRVTSVSVTLERAVGAAEWPAPRVAITYGRGWGVTAVSVPGGLRQVPPWLDALVREVIP